MKAKSTVHIVDDETSIRESVHALLESAGFEVRSYNSAEAFLDCWDGACPSCLLADIRLPGMDGITLFRTLSQQSKTPPPTVFMTGYGSVARAKTAMRYGAVGFITKPFKEDELFANIGEAISLSRHRQKELELEDCGEDLLERLSPREKEVFELIAMGLNTADAARHLGVSPRTIETHRMHITQKISARNVADFVRIDMHMARKAGAQ